MIYIVAILLLMLGLPGLLNRNRNNPNVFVMITMTFFLMFIGILFAGLVCAKEHKDTRIHVAVIDTGVNVKLAHLYMCKDGHKDLTGKGLNDVHGHGTNVAGVLAKTMNTNTHCLQIIKWYHDSSKMSEPYQKLMEDALDTAHRYNAKYINMSLSGAGPIASEFALMSVLLSEGTEIYVSAGNNSRNLDVNCNAFPACYRFNYPNFHVVGAYDVPVSNKGSWIEMEHGNNVEGFGVLMSGSSQATAVRLSKRL